MSPPRAGASGLCAASGLTRGGGADRVLQLLGRDVADVGPEPPRVALRILRGVGAVAVELIRGLACDLGPRRLGVLEVAVDVVDVDVGRLRPAAELGRVLELPARRAEHDERAPELELGVDRSSVRPRHPLALAEAEGAA